MTRASTLIIAALCVPLAARATAADARVEAVHVPGSALFVVWQQARANVAVPGGFDFGRDLHGIFGVPPQNVFLVKLSYWLNY